MATPEQETIHNSLLSGLPISEYQRLSPYLHPVPLRLREVLFKPGDQLQEVYFPITSIVSLLTDLSDGTGMEVGLVGKEGMVGISVILGGNETKLATVQAAGHAFRLSSEVVKNEFRQGGTFQVLLLRYTHTLMTHISQSVVCNVRHPIDARLARWLLMYHDRLERDKFELTHEFMAAMLGVRRSSISEVALKLQQKALITYHRGQIEILDRAGLEEFACECYLLVKKRFDEFLLSSYNISPVED